MARITTIPSDIPTIPEAFSVALAMSERSADMYSIAAIVTGVVASPIPIPIPAASRPGSRCAGLQRHRPCPAGDVRSQPAPAQCR
jgi:hypothetical protein